MSDSMDEARDWLAEHYDSSAAADHLARVLAAADMLDVDNYNLRQQVQGHCDRIAAQAALLARTAEKDALARLEAWQEPTVNYYRIYPGRLELMAWAGGAVAAFSCPLQFAAHGPRKDSFGTGRVGEDSQCVTVGTDEAPASLSACILAALELWQKVYGEQNGGA